AHPGRLHLQPVAQPVHILAAYIYNLSHNQGSN
ncbi:hypothetical protein, partial [Pseudomonas aeruginosa]